MKKSAIVCLLLAFVMVASTFAMAEAVLSVTGTDVTDTDVTDTDVTGTDVLAFGDLNGDKKVDAKDALLILKAAVEKITLTEKQLAVANVYVDSKIDAKDALYVLRFAVDKIDTLPYTPDTVTDTDVTGTDVTKTNA